MAISSLATELKIYAALSAPRRLDGRIRAVLPLLRQNLEREIDLHKVAANVGLSMRQVERLFRAKIAFPCLPTGCARGWNLPARSWRAALGT